MLNIPVTIGMNVVSGLLSNAIIHGIEYLSRPPKVSNPSKEYDQKELLEKLKGKDPIAVKIIYPDGDNKPLLNNIFEIMNEDVNFIADVDVSNIIKTIGKPKFIIITDYQNILSYMNPDKDAINEIMKGDKFPDVLPHNTIFIITGKMEAPTIPTQTGEPKKEETHGWITTVEERLQNDLGGR